MKTTYLVSCGLLAMVLSMCGRHGGADEPLLVDSVVIDTSTVVGKNNGAKYHLDLNIKTFAEPQYRQLNIAMIDSLLTPNIVDLYDTAGITPRQRIEQYVKSTASSDYRLTTVAQRNDDGLVNYIGQMESTVNGQQTTYGIALNIDLQRQRILSLSDVFEEKDNEGLVKSIVKQLCKQTGTNDLQALQEQGFFTHTPPYAPDNFILGSDDITFIYVPGEIASREKGEIKVTVDR